MTTASGIAAPPDDPTRDYGTKVAAVEPGGVERIPLGERHGRPLQLLWTWASPNLEFATVFVGVLAVAVFGLRFWQAVAAILIGSALGGLAHGVLSTWGPRHGLAQMVLGRSAFGYWGNLLPAGLMSVTAGVGWFAVNSVSGAFALNTLLGLSKEASLVIVVAAQILVAFFGHNLVHVFERLAFPFLAVIFLIAVCVVFSHAHPSASAGSGGSIGGFLAALGASFGYAAGWNPYASDYTRYLRPDVPARRVGWSAGLGNAGACVLLEVAGAAAVTAVARYNLGEPTASFTGIMPTWLADLTLVAIAVGAVSANVLNIYSGAMAFLTMGVRLPFRTRRALVAVGFGLIGLAVAFTGLSDAGEKYENFLLVIAYWIAPWLGVVFTDRLRSGFRRIDAVVESRRHTNWAGPIAMAVAMVVSILLFSDQTEYVGYLASKYPAIGDITFEVGFVIAAGLYAILARVPALRSAERV